MTLAGAYWGIIPAHAGFTAYRPPAHASAQDHPRTRGVYWLSSSVTRITPGSSPHTRGLHASLPGVTRWSRIIPAHAGFTLPGQVARSGQQDHPRTRGVYRASGASQDLSPGSSPHTRGLPAVCVWDGGQGGIIPAHAGFTSPPLVGVRGCEDHPRTRGVYPIAVATTSGSYGSSPHTRGLRVRAAPARPSAPDHPRTRGVYIVIVLASPHTRGSSPHTRGLLIGATGHVGSRVDHPRTRGVYCLSVHQDPTQHRIIPAHAGFTRRPVLCPVPARDHPRTRGVYAPCPGGPAAAAGSSPHTRGLLSPGWYGTMRVRIIPAHAGFTRGPHRGPQEPRDHPRTRGVYISRSTSP